MNALLLFVHLTLYIPPVACADIYLFVQLTVRSLRKYVTESLLSTTQWKSSSSAQLPTLELYCNNELLAGADHSLEFIYKTKWMHSSNDNLIKITYRWPDRN